MTNKIIPTVVLKKQRKTSLEYGEYQQVSPAETIVFVENHEIWKSLLTFGKNHGKLILALKEFEC